MNLQTFFFLVSVCLFGDNFVRTQFNSNADINSDRGSHTRLEVDFGGNK